MNSLLDYPEVKSIFGALLDDLLRESPRGAIIIGATAVEEQLSLFIEEILPRQEKKYKNSLLKYPGPISSFSAKIELAFAFRLIDRSLYNSLKALKNIRNEAAHNRKSFSIDNYRGKLDVVFSLGPYLPTFIRNEAINMMVGLKFRVIESLFEKYSISNDEKERQVKLLIDDQSFLDKLEEQVPYWELIFGLSLVCGVLLHQRETTLKVIAQNKTWSALANRKESGHSNGA